MDALAVLFTQWSALDVDSMVLAGGCRADEQHGRLRGRDVYRVVTVKRGELTFVAIDDGVDGDLEAGAGRPSVSAPASSIGLDAADGETVSVVGRQSASGDVLVGGVRSPASRAADLLGVPATGAYCCPMANNDMRNRRIPVV